MAASVIGLDIGTTKVRAVEVTRGRGAPTVTHYAEAPVPLGAMRDGEVVEPEGVVTALRQMWAHGKFTHRDVIMAVGNQRVLVRNLELPWMPMPQIRSSLPFQVQDSLPVDVHDALLDFYPTSEGQGPGGRTVSGLLVAATRDTVAANLAAADSAGLRPLMVDLTGFALLRGLTVRPPEARTVAYVDFGARTTTVVIAEHGVPQLVRSLPVGGQNLTDAVAMTLSIPAGEAENLKRQIGVGFAVAPEMQAAAQVINQVTQSLVESVRNTFVYYASNHPGRATEYVLISGGGAYLSGLGQYLSSASRLPVTIGDAISSVQVARTADLSVLSGAETTFAVPLGLALGVAE